MTIKKSPAVAMTSMSECVNRLTNEGYTENFKVTKTGIKALSDDSFFEPTDVAITNFFRFEGQSDPSDNAIVYAIETSDGKKGLLIDAYGSDADAKIGEFIVNVDQIQKKIKTS